MPSTTVRRRTELETKVSAILSSFADGRVTATKESQEIDFKEEAGRRGPGGSIEPGESQNAAAAKALADEVACFANSKGGGAIVLGVEDRTGEVIGTELDEGWLRDRIYSAITVAPDIVVHEVGGQRVLVLYTAQSPDPVEDTADRLRWRVADHCQPVDRSEW